MIKALIIAIILVVISPFAYNYYQDRQKQETIADLDGPDKSCVSCDLSGVDLEGRDLSGYDLSSADLSGANLRCTNLSGANLTSTVLRGANITGSKLTGATLGRDTNMEQVVWDDGKPCS